MNLLIIHFFKARRKKVPSKRIHTRTELLNQLSKIADLYDKGKITKELHDKLQADVLSDVNVFIDE